jgi:hypothetical protein
MPNIEKLPFRADGDSVDIAVSFHARNGAWNQSIWMRRVGQTWFEATKVFRYESGRKVIKYRKVDAGFPKDQIKNWDLSWLSP